MNRINHVLLAIFYFMFCSINSAREVITLQSGWKFAKGQNDQAMQINFDDSKWQTVSVPHDWAIAGPVILDGDGSTGKLPWKGEGWYRNKLDIPASYSGKKIYLVFDGIMAFPEIYINGILAGKWDYGYNSFYLDVTSYFQPGKENTITVHADTRNHESRWYPGAGIYRKIQMIVVEPIHVNIWGSYITTPIVKSHYADIRIMTTVNNLSANNESEIKIENTILNQKGIELAKKSAMCSINAGSSRNVEVTIPLINPQRWDITNPVLYKVKTTIHSGNNLTDTYISSFGVRTIRFTANDGFYLNDKRVQLKGVNLHHDQGLLGTAFYPRAMERQLEIMKSMGCNAVRTSHNPPAPELLDLCDKMGILVLDEAFDKYDRHGDILENTDFEDFAQRNMKNFIMRDRNHPSIFLWSVGNEIGDVQNNINNGFLRLQTMINYVRKYDSTRPVTLVCDNQNSAVLRHFDYYDIHCWNYGRRYNLARQLEPNKSVIISESASTLSTRGFFEFPLPKSKIDFTKSLQVSSYDLNAPEWAEVADDDFMWQQEENYIAGEFMWTGFDYIGEPDPYTNRSVKEKGFTDKEASRISYFGIVDLCGIPKDRYYLYKSYWKPDETTIHILPHWNWKGKEGDTIPVFVYTNGDCAELFLNGKSLGMRYKNPKSQKSIERFRLMWNDVTYQPGELKAVAYKEGEVIGDSIIKTAGEPYSIKITPDRKVISASGMDLSYLFVEAYDRDGNFCPLANNKIEININGNATIAAVGNGNPQSLDSFQSNTTNLFNGKAMVIIKSNSTKGDVVISASGKDLKRGSTTIKME